MKHKFKIYGIVLLCLFSLSIGCSKDDYQIDQQRRELGSKVSFEQFKNETGLKEFKTSIQVKRKKNGALNKNADGSYELTDFDIDTDVIKKMEFKENVGYTFKVHSKDKSDEKMYNLVMFYKDGNWESIIVALRPTQEVLDGLKLNPDISFNGDIALIYDSDAMNRGVECFSVVRVTTGNCPRTGVCETTCDMCAYCVRVTKATFCGGAELTEVYESMQNEDGSAGGGGGGHTGSTPTTPTPPADPTLSTPPKKPVLIDPFMQYIPPPPPKTPCDELAKLKNSSNATTALSILQTKTSDAVENGFALKFNSTNTIVMGPEVIHNNPKKPTKLNTAPFLNGNYFGFTHSHTDPISTSCIPIFSPADIEILQSLQKVYNPANGALEASAFMVTVAGKDPTTGLSSTFAIKIKDFDTFYNGMTLDDNFKDMQKELVDLYTVIGPSASMEKCQIAFLSMLKKYNMGIGLYKANADFSGWSEIILNPATNNLKPLTNTLNPPIPCP